VLLNVKKVEVFKGPVPTKLKDDHDRNDFAHRHPEGPFSVFFAILKEPLCESRFKNITELINVKENIGNFIIGNHSGKFS
jgi:hypothetical protein